MLWLLLSAVAGSWIVWIQVFAGDGESRSPFAHWNLISNLMNIHPFILDTICVVHCYWALISPRFFFLWHQPSYLLNHWLFFILLFFSLCNQLKISCQISCLEGLPQEKKGKLQRFIESLSLHFPLKWTEKKSIISYYYTIIRAYLVIQASHRQRKNNPLSYMQYS